MNIPDDHQKIYSKYIEIIKELQSRAFTLMHENLKWRIPQHVQDQPNYDIFDVNYSEFDQILNTYDMVELYSLCDHLERENDALMLKKLSKGCEK